MRGALWLLIINLFIFMPALTMAEVDGKELLQKCEPLEKLYDDPGSMSSKEASGVVYCLGYLDSFMDTFYFQVQAQIVPSLPYCIPDEQLPKKEIAKMVVGYLKNHPEELDKPAGYFIFMALREAYPCSAETNKAAGRKEESKINEK